jgi:hypothetical protein
MTRPAALWFMVCALASCADARHGNGPPTRALTDTDANSIRSLHVRLDVNPADGNVTYLGWYDGKRNLLGPGGITAALVGMEPPEFREGKLEKPNPHELRFNGLDHNHIFWEKTYRLDPESGTKVHVTFRVTNRRDEPFEAIVYSLADLPDATIAGDNRDLYIQAPIAQAHFHAEIENPHFPGEQMSPYAMRSDARRLEPGASMEFRLSWELRPIR